MAPKRASASGSAPKPASKKVKLPPCEPGAALVIRDERIDGGVALESPGKKLASETMDNKIARCVRDNFKGWSYNKTEFTIRNGMSLREKLRHDKEKHTAGDKSMQFGKHYFSELRSLYGSESDPEQLINVTDDSQMIDPKVQDALEGLFDRAKNYDSCILILENMDICNQKTMVGLLRAALTVNPCSTLQGNRFVMAIMQYIVRTKAQETFPTEVGHMKEHFDLALQKCFLDYRKNDLSAVDWWKKHKAHASLVVPPQSAERCFGCNTNWADVEEDLVKVVSSGDVGYLLFGRALQSITATKVQNFLDSSVQMFVGTLITAESVATARATLCTQMKLMGIDAIDVYKAPKITACMYRGVELEVGSVSLVDEWNNKVWGLIKTVAVQASQLDSLFCEDQLASDVKCYPGTTVDQGLLGDAIQVRKAACQYAEGSSEITSEILKNLFAKRGAFMCSIDRSFKIEQLFFEAASGLKGEDRYKVELLRCLPSRPGEKSTEQSLGALTKLTESKLASWVGIGSTAVHQMVANCVKMLHGGRAPKFEASANSAFITKVQNLLANFLVLMPSGGGSGQVALSGKAAAEHIFTALQAKKHAKEEFSLKDLQKSIQFGWLLPDPSKELLEVWRKEVVALGPDVVRPAGKIIAAKAVKTQDKKKCVNSLFKKV